MLLVRLAAVLHYGPQRVTNITLKLLFAVFLIYRDQWESKHSIVSDLFWPGPFTNKFAQAALITGVEMSLSLTWWPLLDLVMFLHTDACHQAARRTNSLSAVAADH